MSNIENALYKKLEQQFDESNETSFYDEITFEQLRDEVSGTDYYITYVPHLDKEGNLIKIEKGFQNDAVNSGDGETARSFAARHMTSLATNASVFNTTTNQIMGNQIKDGLIVQSTTSGVSYTLGVKEDNTLVAYPPSVDAHQILADGCVNTFSAFFPMIENGGAVDPSVYNVIGNPSVPNPRNTIAQMPNKDILIMTVDARTNDNAGMTYEDMIRVLLERGVQFAYSLDGGGSAQTVVRGMLINEPVDGGGFVERKVPDFLYVKKPSTHPEKFKTINEDIGTLSKRLFDLERFIYDKAAMNKGYIQLKGGEGVSYQGIEAWEGDTKYGKISTGKDNLSYYDYINSSYLFQVLASGDLITRKGTFGTFLNRAKTVSDCNTIDETGLYWATSSTANTPDGITYGILHFQAGSVAALQVAFPYHSDGEAYPAKMRRVDTNQESGWGAWRPL